MFIATIKKKAATVTWYIMNTISTGIFLRKKQCNDDIQYM